MKLDTPPERLDVDGKGLLVAQGEPGICRVICFSPRHDLTLATMGVDAIELVVRTWTEQFRELGEMPGINHVQIFENRGAMMGASNPHPHCQIWASASMPDAPAKELASQQKYFLSVNRCLLCDYIEIERRLRVRVVAENARFIALVPFWAVWPFEILLCSRKHIGSMNDFANNNDDAPQLSAILQQVTSTYDKVFGVPFPYSMGFHQSPPMALIIRSVTFTPISIRRFYAQQPSANSWSASKCWEPRNATSLPRARPNACANSPARSRPTLVPRNCLESKDAAKFASGRNLNLASLRSGWSHPERSRSSGEGRDLPENRAWGDPSRS